jgi:PiT family inorganic phosphate transporter
MLVLVSIVLVAFVSFIIAANNSANSIGVLYGSNITTYYKAAIISGLFVMIGVVLEGWKMGGAIGGGIIEGEMSLFMSLIVLVTVIILLFLFTFLSMPLSASQLMVGAVIGVAIFSGLFVNVSFLSLILVSWIATFLAGMGIAYLLYHLIARVAKHMRIFSLSKFYTLSLYIGAAFIAYTLGANTIGLLASLVSNSYIYLIAGISALIGTILFGKRTVRTVGENITSLDPARAFAALFGGAIIVELFTQFHLPVSMTQAVVGGIIGTGFVKGYRDINKRTVKNLALSWVLAPLVSFVVAYILMDAF